MTLAAWSRKLKPRSCRNGRRGALPPLVLFTDEARLPDPAAAMARLPRGSGVIFRHYAARDREALAHRLAKLSRQRGLLFLVAGDAALARRVGADGLHLPEHRLRHRLPPHNPAWLVTAAAHSLPAALRAERLGIDAVFVSPVFPTDSHPGAPALGPRRLAEWIGALTIPVYALGGVTAGTARALTGTGIAGVAAIGGLAG